MPRPRTDLLQGTLDLMILKTLSWGPMHGYAVARWLEQVTEDALRVEEGTLYPALHRLAEQGWIESEWGLSENNRRARYYRLTAGGRRQLREQLSSWTRIVETVGKVIASTARPSTAVAT